MTLSRWQTTTDADLAMAHRTVGAVLLQAMRGVERCLEERHFLLGIGHLWASCIS